LTSLNLREPVFCKCIGFLTAFSGFSGAPSRPLKQKIGGKCCPFASLTVPNSQIEVRPMPTFGQSAANSHIFCHQLSSLPYQLRPQCGARIRPASPWAGISAESRSQTTKLRPGATSSAPVNGMNEQMKSELQSRGGPHSQADREADVRLRPRPTLGFRFPAFPLSTFLCIIPASYHPSPLRHVPGEYKMKNNP